MKALLFLPLLLTQAEIAWSADSAFEVLVTSEGSVGADREAVTRDLKKIEAIVGCELPHNYVRAMLQNPIKTVSYQDVFSAERILDELQGCELFEPFTKQRLLPISGYYSCDFILIDADTGFAFLINITRTDLQDKGNPPDKAAIIKAAEIGKQLWTGHNLSQPQSHPQDAPHASAAQPRRRSGYTLPASPPGASSQSAGSRALCDSAITVRVHGSGICQPLQ